jgi:hypothetical protein
VAKSGYVIGLMVLLACPPLHAQNSKLDAPVSRQPTVCSEIDRGQSAGFDCALKNVAHLPAFVSCINNVVAANQQSSTISDPFLFGLYLRALQNAFVEQKTLTSDGNFQIWRTKVLEIMKATHLSFKDFCQAAHAEKCDVATMRAQTLGTP